MSRAGSSRVWMLIAAIAVSWVIGARMLGPFDLWDQTQPRTVAYTADILAHGNWVLPLERGEMGATKPPLYNWLAAPIVAVAGAHSEFAHKAPSAISLIGVCMMLGAVGRRVAPETILGAVAAVAFAANYTIFKLAYLARPDMLLTLWLVLGWVAATTVIASGRRHGAWSLLFWLCVGLAGLTKGPAAAVLPVYALVLARALHGRWRTAGALGWWWGLPAAGAMVGAWLLAAIQVDVQHVREVLWGSEIWGRVTGLGAEGNRHGPVEWLTNLYYMPLYYVARFAPWSVLSILALIDLTKRGASGVRAWRELPVSERTWLVGSVIFVLVVVAMFTLSTGKRADYISAAFAPGSLLAAWWMVRLPGRWRDAVPAALSGATLLALTIANQRFSHSPCPGFADGVENFMHDVVARVRAEPAPLVTWRFGPFPVQALVGVSEPELGDQSVLDALKTGDEFWVVVGLPAPDHPSFELWLNGAAPHRTADPIAASAHLCREAGWPEQAFLYRVSAASTNAAPR
jgi:4-amino-4-deoxy-L-arabinose transferase-like glycosyltransferase